MKGREKLKFHAFQLPLHCSTTFQIFQIYYPITIFMATKTTILNTIKRTRKPIPMPFLGVLLLIVLMQIDDHLIARDKMPVY